MTPIIRLSGTAFTDAQLDNGQEVHVVITNGDGVDIANGFGKVQAVTDRPRKDSPDIIERIFSVRVS